MQLSPQEKSRIWWNGTIKSAMKGLAIGLVMGACSALLLQFALIPMFPAIGEAFAGFLTLTPGLTAGWSGVVPLASFSTVPLAVFSGVSGLVASIFGGGRDAVAKAEADLHTASQEHQIHELEVHTAHLEQQHQPVALSPQIRAILDRGPQSFSAAEEARANAPSSQIRH